MTIEVLFGSRGHGNTASDQFLIPTVQRDGGPGATGQAEAAGPPGIRQVRLHRHQRSSKGCSFCIADFLLCSCRAEGLKESQSRSAAVHSQDRSGSSGPKASTSSGSDRPLRQFFPLGADFSLNERPQPLRAVQSSEPHGQRYSSEEIEVLRSVHPPAGGNNGNSTALLW